MESYFDWQQFFDQLNALSRWFSIRARCDRFVSVCIRQNPCVQVTRQQQWQQSHSSLLLSMILQRVVRCASQGIRLKQSFEELFKSTCPTMVSTCWGYLYLGRQQVCFCPLVVKHVKHDSSQARGAIMDVTTSRSAFVFVP